MGLNKKFVKMKNDRRAEMGVGTMIIFIAMVLVAAIAASVLMSTANNVREQATQTGNDAIQGVASGFDLMYVKGTVENNSITQMDVYVHLYAGSPAIVLDTVTLSVTAGNVSNELTFNHADPNASYASNPDDPDSYGATLIPPAQSTDPFGAYGTVAQGDLVKITIADLDGAPLSISPGASVLIKIIPDHGSTTTISFTIPAVLYNGSVNLR